MSQSVFLQKVLTFLGLKPGPKQIAKQLRHPKGKLGEMVAKKMNESNEFLYDFTLESMKIESNSHILEIGFGNGKFFDKIFSKGLNLKISGIDYSELMVTTARQNNALAIEAGNLKIYYSNSEALPLDSNIFDKVFCINVVYFWENPREILEEIYRVLKPGGKFYTSIRLKDSIGHLPYTQYGFTLYEEEGWKSKLVQNRFLYNEGLNISEPEFILNGNSLHFESICMVAQKPV